MARRPEPCKVFTWDNQVDGALTDRHLKSDAANSNKGVGGILYGVNLSWSALTVGDRIAIHDTDTAAGDVTAAKKFVFTVPTTAGSVFIPVGNTVGRRFDNGLWLNNQLTPGGKFALEIDFD